MPTYLAPGVFIEERSSGVKPIEGVSTSVAAFIGVAARGPVAKAVLVTSAAEFLKILGDPIPVTSGVRHYLGYAVLNFFAMGGTKAYVVRVAHFNDIDDFSTLQATAAATPTAFSSALSVAAIHPGIWGRSLEVQAFPSSRFNVRLAENVAAGATTSLSLVENSDVRVGSLLWVIEEASGVVATVQTNGDVTFTGGWSTGSDPFSGSVGSGIPVFTPDFGLVTATDNATAVTVTAGTAPTGISLAGPATGIVRSDGTPLKRGDVLTFAIRQHLVVVTRVTAAMLGSVPITRVEFTSTTFAALDRAHSRAYHRDFTLRVRQRLGATTTVLETHPNLSLVGADVIDHVEVRLKAPDRLSPAVVAGESLYVVGTDLAASPTAVIDDTGWVALTGGNDGLANLADADFIGSEITRTGLRALDVIKDASILAVPGAAEATAVPTVTVSKAAIAYAERRQSIVFVADPPQNANDDILTYRTQLGSTSYAALYYPRIRISGTEGLPLSVPPSGAVAGAYAATDGLRGVHKAPAGIESGSLGVAIGLDRLVTRGENDVWYQRQVNIIRGLPEGITVWGARTLSVDAEFKYLNVRRLLIFLEQSIERGTQWVTFEPNDASLWKSIARNVRAFLRIQWREGKLVGDTESQAFYVKCDAETNPPEVVEAGQVITEIGVAPSKPAEFVIFRIRQLAGQER